jgi:uncharacterized protein YfeS
MTTTKFYFDDPEGEGPSRETSHPNFVKLLNDEFYYDCTDEFSPFGNDDGADILFILEDWYKENGKLSKPVKFVKDYIDENLGFETKHVKVTDKAKILKINAEEEFIFDSIDHAIIATAFGQYKIEGTLNPDLKELANIALDRQKIITQNQIDNNEIEFRKLVKIVDEQTTRPDEDGGMNETFKMYLDRLNKMKDDLQLLT